MKTRHRSHLKVNWHSISGYEISVGPEDRNLDTARVNITSMTHRVPRNSKNTEEIRTEANIGLDYNTTTHKSSYAISLNRKFHLNTKLHEQHMERWYRKRSNRLKHITNALQVDNVSHQHCIGRSHANSAHKIALIGKALFHQRFRPTAAWRFAVTQQNESSRL